MKNRTTKNGTDSEKFAFTPDEQLRVQELIDDAYKKALRKAKRLYERHQSRNGRRRCKRNLGRLRADRYIVGSFQPRLTLRQAKKRLKELLPYRDYEVIYELVEVKPLRRTKGAKNEKGG